MWEAHIQKVNYLLIFLWTFKRIDPLSIWSYRVTGGNSGVIAVPRQPAHELHT